MNEDLSLNLAEDLTRGNVSLNGFAEIDVTFGGGGDINIYGQNINVLGGSDICAGIGADGACGERNENFGSLDAQSGDIFLNATDTVTIDGGISDVNNRVNSESFGNSGNINIETDSLVVSNGGRINTNIFGIGNSGKITINSNFVEFFGRTETDVPSGIFSSLEAEGEGNTGDINVSTNTLILRDRVQFSNNIEGVGNGGDINLEAADEIRLESSAIFTEVSAPTKEDPGGVGDAGDININTGSLFLLNGSSLLADLENEGNAGNININATERFILEGRGNAFFTDFGITPSQISSTVESQAIGNGGNISIQTPSLIVKDTAFVSVTSEGRGMTGIVDIKASEIELENRGSILAETVSGAGGNIFLDVDNILLFRKNSLISAQAFNDANGGNINIDADFIIAFPYQGLSGNGSDIIASAVGGEGGEIDIDAQSLFGIQEREAIENNQTNDIDASSQFSLDGNVTINTPDINPIQGATELPNNLVTPEQTVTQACSNRGVSQANSLVVKGKGGVPALPTDSLSSETITINGEPVNNSDYSAYVIPTAQGNIIPARGVIKTAEGQVILTAVPISNRESRVPHNLLNCG